MNITHLKTIFKSVLATSILATSYSAIADFDISAIQTQQESAIAMQDRMQQMTNKIERSEAMQANMQSMTETLQNMQAAQEQIQNHTHEQLQTALQKHGATNLQTETETSATAEANPTEMPSDITSQSSSDNSETVVAE